MPRYRLLALDIDGTLVNSRDELTPATQEAILRAGKAGVQVVLATGRRYSRARHLAEPLAIDVPIVTASGALIKDPLDHRTLFRAEFAPGVLREMSRVIDRFGYDPILCADSFSDGFDFFYLRNPPRKREMIEYFELNPDDGRSWPGMLDEPPPGVFLVFTMGSKEEMLALDLELHKALPGKLTTNVLRSPRYRGFLVEASAAGITKWSGIRQLASDLGIRDEEICAVGDDVNDIDMIRQAGLGVAMGNALPEVKAAADRVAPTHDEDGLVSVVKWVIG